MTKCYQTAQSFLLALFFIVFLFLQDASASDLAVHFLNVGQGDSLLVQFPDGQNMLVDTGPGSASQSVVNYLKKQGVKRIDILVGTHPHEDHIGGSVAVLSALPVGKVWDSGYVHGSKVQQRYLQTIKDKGIRFGKPKAGFTEQIGGATVEVLGPVREFPGEPNDNCLVLRVIYGKVSFLLMADAEEAERATLGSLPRSTVLKVGHHGSHNGTDAALLNQIKPEIAVISYAVGNSYGHPHKEALAALRSAKVKWYTTTGGAVVITTDGMTYSVKSGMPGGASGGAIVAPATGSAVRQSAAKASSGGYIGNRNMKKFHLPTCGTLPAPKNQVMFGKRDEAVRAGYVACKRCKP